MFGKQGNEGVFLIRNAGKAQVIRLVVPAFPFLIVYEYACFAAPYGFRQRNRIVAADGVVDITVTEVFDRVGRSIIEKKSAGGIVYL